MSIAAPLILYGGLAVLALAATARDDDLRWIGLWLLGGFIISNALFFYGVPPLRRAGPYTAIEIMVAVAASCAVVRARVWMILILGCNLLSIAANIALLLNNPPTRQQVYAWNVATNAAFAAECLLAIGAGGGYGYFAGLFAHRIRLRRHSPTAGVAREKPE